MYTNVEMFVLKTWTTHTATHAVKLLTGLKEYTDLQGGIKKTKKQKHTTAEAG